MSDADGHKAKPDHAPATLVPQGGAGDRQHTIVSDGRPHAVYPQKGQHGDQPRQRSHPNSPASSPDLVEPVSQLPSPDPFSDSNENADLYQSSGPSSRDFRYTTPPVWRHLRPPQNDYGSRDRRSPPMLLPTEILDGFRPKPVNLDGARHLDYGPIPIPEGLLPPLSRPKPSQAITDRILGRMSHKQDFHTWLDRRVPSASLDPTDAAVLHFVHQMMDIGLTLLRARASDPAASTTSSESEEEPQSNDLAVERTP